MHTKLKMRRNHGLETTSEPINTHRSTTSVIISFKGKRIYKRTLIQMRPELQQEYKKHQNQGRDWNHYKCALPRQTSLHLCRSGNPSAASGQPAAGRWPAPCWSTTPPLSSYQEAEREGEGEGDDAKEKMGEQIWRKSTWICYWRWRRRRWSGGVAATTTTAASWRRRWF